MKRLLGSVMDKVGAMVDRVLTGGVLLKIAAVFLVLIILYYPIGMVISNKVDDDIAYEPPRTEGGSASVDMAAGLIQREVEVNGWVANNPFFFPSGALDNMPEFQMGILYALSRYALEMSDQIGRTRGSSQVDKDLDLAAGRLKLPGTVWYIDFSTSFWPQSTSEDQYMAARRALLAYNTRLAKGDAVFEARADNLQASLDRFAKDLGSASALLDRQIRDGGFFTFKDDNVFYATKGRLYGYAMILKAMGEDFANVIAERQLDSAWAQMVQSLEQAAEMDPLVVFNGTPGGLFPPSHLADQGFYLLRSRTQMNEVIAILQK
ncbi:DUF2333 family protein [Rhodospirillum sp. A1_3_36]|uniref:DUF2333 family protein n=1 Tax=Rhodospirillum sp. A1_3_36 TaxID=3391666 RepID=UPI0039A6B643